MVVGKIVTVNIITKIKIFFFSFLQSFFKIVIISSLVLSLNLRRNKKDKARNMQ